MINRVTQENRNARLSISKTAMNPAESVAKRRKDAHGPRLIRAATAARKAAPDEEKRSPMLLRGKVGELVAAHGKLRVSQTFKWS